MLFVLNSGGAGAGGAADYDTTLDAKYDTYQATMEAYAFANALTNPITSNVSDSFWGMNVSGRSSQNTYYDSNDALVITTSNNTTAITRYSSTAQFTSNVASIISGVFKFVHGQDVGTDINTGGLLLEVDNVANDATAFSFVPANTLSTDTDYTTYFAGGDIDFSATHVCTSGGNKFLCGTNASGQVVLYPVDSDYKITGAATDTEWVGTSTYVNHTRVIATRGDNIWVACAYSYNDGVNNHWAETRIRLYSVSTGGVLSTVDTVDGVSVTDILTSAPTPSSHHVHCLDDGGTDVFVAISAMQGAGAGADDNIYTRAAYKIDTSVTASVSETVLANENGTASANYGTWLNTSSGVYAAVCMVEGAEFYFYDKKVSTAGGAVGSGDATMPGNTGFTWSSTAARRTYNTQSGNQTSINCKDKTLTIPSTDGLDINYVRDDDAGKEFVMIANDSCVGGFVAPSGELSASLSTQLQINAVNQGSAQVHTLWSITPGASEGAIPGDNVGITARSIALSNIAIAVKYVEVTAINTPSLTETSVTWEGSPTNKIENKFTFDADGGTYATPTFSASKISNMLINF
ncbi:MAG: hypothetical protein V3U02_04465 [Calditrichia bacterium]